ncbi:hypothetical protein Efla_003147 [Eimeria flavescens]
MPTVRGGLLSVCRSAWLPQLNVVFRGSPPASAAALAAAMSTTARAAAAAGSRTPAAAAAAASGVRTQADAEGKPARRPREAAASCSPPSVATAAAASPPAAAAGAAEPAASRAASAATAAAAGRAAGSRGAASREESEGERLLREEAEEWLRRTETVKPHELSLWFLHAFAAACLSVRLSFSRLATSAPLMLRHLPFLRPAEIAMLAHHASFFLSSSSSSKRFDGGSEWVEEREARELLEETEGQRSRRQAARRAQRTRRQGDGQRTDANQAANTQQQQQQQQRHAEWWLEFGRRAAQSLQDADGREVSMLLAAVAKSQIPQPVLLPVLLAEAEAWAADNAPRNNALILHSLGRIGCSSSEAAVTAACSSLKAKAAELNHIDCCMAIHGAARIGVKDPSFYDCLLQQAERLLPQMDEHNVAMIVWALGTNGLQQAKFLEGAARHLLRISSSREIASGYAAPLLNGFARLRFVSPSVLSFAEAALRSAARMQPGDLCIACTGEFQAPNQARSPPAFQPTKADGGRGQLRLSASPWCTSTAAVSAAAAAAAAIVAAAIVVAAAARLGLSMERHPASVGPLLRRLAQLVACGFLSSDKQIVNAAAAACALDPFATQVQLWKAIGPLLVAGGRDSRPASEFAPHDAATVALSLHRLCQQQQQQQQQLQQQGKETEGRQQEGCRLAWIEAFFLRLEALFLFLFFALWLS